MESKNVEDHISKRLILCGYHWSGCKALELLLQKKFDVYVYTHKAEKCVADLEGLCVKWNIKYTTEKISIQNMPFIPDAICSIYYRYLISSEVIHAVGGRIFNLHPALLPKYRGCSSLTWAMINGEETCGFTFHYIDDGCDTGNVLIQRKMQIEPFDTQLTLYNRVMFESMNYFLEALGMVIEGKEGCPQCGEYSYYNRGCPMDGIITDDMSDDEAERFIRAMIYPPYPLAEYKGKNIQTWLDLVRLRGGENLICIYGCGGHARSVYDILNRFCVNSFDVLFIDENALPNETICDCLVLKSHILTGDEICFVAIGDNPKRKIVMESLESRGAHMLTIISPTSRISETATVGDGVFIADNAYIGTDSSISKGTIINTGAVIEHEVKIGEFSHVAPNATICGRTVVGNNVFCGASSVLKEKITVCDDVVIGAGAVVVHDIEESGVYVGNPLYKLKEFGAGIKR